MGWRGETGAAAFQWRREVGRQLAKLRATLQFCEREEEGGNGEESAQRQLSP
jgi:hypothetical protein